MTHETDVTDAGHSPDWYHTVEELSGAVTQSLQQDLDEVSLLDD